MIRDAVETDLPAIVQIYNAAIPSRMATADIDPVSVEERLTWFRAHTPTRYPLWVMESNAAVVGWLGFQSFYGRPAYHVTAEISLYVAPLLHRQGIGKQLLRQAIQQSPALGFTALLGFIFSHNLPSLRLFEGLAFQRWGYLPGIARLDGVERDLVILGRRVGTIRESCPALRDGQDSL